MNLLNFSFIIGRLKILKRIGWVNHEVLNPESVADHSFRTTVLVMALAPKVKADKGKSIKMALIHDIGEAKIGDIVTRSGAEDLPNLQEKLAAERNAIKTIFSLVDNEEYVKLFDEFEENKTKEAKLVKQVDKLEMAIQAYEYEKLYKINLQDFFDDSKNNLFNKDLKKILKEILELRKL